MALKVEKGEGDEFLPPFLSSGKALVEMEELMLVKSEDTVSGNKEEAECDVLS